ncbi:hypothetical protein ACIRSS_18090 [Amycolatopsis sp. NPDC101161]|uniref:hypothetical protein n=1 Tax=Amycolatopsis sp. NPDC101161 TaxID=3363940 RepID=UPI00381F6E06
MFGKKKTEDEAASCAVVHLMLSRMKPEHRQGVLSGMSDEDRRLVLEAELEGRQDRWNRTHDTKWGES